LNSLLREDRRGRTLKEAVLDAQGGGVSGPAALRMVTKEGGASPPQPGRAFKTRRRKDHREKSSPSDERKNLEGKGKENRSRKKPDM